MPDFQKDLEALNRIPAPLLRWYDAGARVLPWRSDPQPYYVWLSEIMLQQTRVEAATPYFERFIAELPSIADLAAAPEEQLLKLWAVSYTHLDVYKRQQCLVPAALRSAGFLFGIRPPCTLNFRFFIRPVLKKHRKDRERIESTRPVRHCPALRL